MNLRDVQLWREEQLARSRFSVEPIDASRLGQWSFRDGQLVHDSGGFFSAGGLRFRDARAGGHACQPFIFQPEIGILGFMLAQRGDDICLLVQAKTEPGNFGGVQLAPSFQCTESNYQRRHGGSRAPFYEFFEGDAGRKILCDSRQSEQGTRFYNKYNRNVLVEVSDDSVQLEHPKHAAWRWMPFAGVRHLIPENLIFNTDARSVIAVSDWDIFCIGHKPFERWAKADGFGHELWKSYRETPSRPRVQEIRDWLGAQQQKISHDAQPVGLKELRGWEVSELGILATGANAVSVKYYGVQALDREVPRWSQPLITAATQGLVMLVAQVRSSVLKFLVRVSPEPGFANNAQLSAPFQVFPGEPKRDEHLKQMLKQWADASGRSPVLIDCLMSEEGGRFFHDMNRYIVALAPESHAFPEEESSRWLTLGEITALKQTPGVFTNEFRSALSLLVHYL